ncbi:MAG: class I SAM-dependent methyltransferase [Opitutales bacterium]|nr:class I SAM-dependent methyltransferase [Opitutales bacterium]
MMLNDPLLKAPEGHRFTFDESAWIRSMFTESEANRTIVDVGAHKGSVFAQFAHKGWTVHAIEPNPPLYKQLTTEWFDFPRVHIYPVAIHESERDHSPLFTSPESDGVTTLEPFLKSHTSQISVKTTTLRSLLESIHCRHVDFLKIDAEGLDYFVLKSYPWEHDRPDVILCEFEDRKTLPLGYKMADMAKFLESHDYAVFVSEWDPIQQYGGYHTWHRLERFPCDVRSADAWGNLIGLRKGLEREVPLENLDTYLHRVINVPEIDLSQIRSAHVLLYGASTRGAQVLETVQEHTEAITFCDKSTKKQVEGFNGIPVISPDQIIDLNPDFIIITSSFEKEIFLELDACEIETNIVFSARGIRGDGHHESH